MSYGEGIKVVYVTSGFGDAQHMCPKKLERHSKLCLFVGYPKEMKCGMFYDPQENRMFVSTNATFLEEDHVRNHQPRNKLVLSEISKEATDKNKKSC